MSVTIERTRERRDENTGSSTTDGGPKPIVRKTPNVDKFIELLTDNPSMTGETDLKAATDPVQREKMVSTVITRACNGDGRLNDCFNAVGREVPEGTSARAIARGVLMLAASA